MGTTITIDFHGDWNTVLSLDRSAPKTERDRLYIIEFEDGTLKIGVTRNLKGRVTNLCQTRRGLGLCAMPKCLAFSDPHINALENERVLLEDCGFERGSGEHVRAAFGDVRAAADRLIFRTEPTQVEAEKSRSAGEAWGRTLGQFGFRRMPQALTPAEMTTALDTVAAARRVYGAAAARELWLGLGLPSVPAMTARPASPDLFTYREDA